VLSILLAALSAGIWGTGDFSGGKASQKANPFAVTLVSQIIGLPVLALCVIFFGHGAATVGELGRGAIAGVAGFVGIVLLYRGLSRGAMAIFAPVTAVTSALVPLVVGLVTEGTPGPLPLAGAFCAIVAIGLVSISGGSGSIVTPRLIGLALASGVMFGVFFAVLGQSGQHAGMWPLVGVRIGSIAAGIAVVLVTRTSLRLPPGSLRWTALAGPFDIGANALFLLASVNGPLTIVAPIAALYPVSTVLLALGIDRERVRPVQLAGLGLAATALVLVAS
jgi:drug/metabolite transporter (DMT)-like permease